jgi:hypothetical protein
MVIQTGLLAMYEGVCCLDGRNIRHGRDQGDDRIC